MARGSRTGTAKWKHIVTKARARAIDEGQAHCPRCRTWLDWEHSGRPNSVEVDHIIPHAQGGPDSLDNARCICQRCNRQLGGMQNRKRERPTITATDLDTSPIW